tara:strand:- start:1326 stop:1664 length:339 start_codon:yes stop_codon:yes gene_type:complete
MFEAKTKLDKILHDKGWTTKDLERALHERDLKIEYYALTEYRSGKRKNMTIETLNKLCVTLEVTPNDLVELDASPVPHKRKYEKSVLGREIENTTGDVEVIQEEEEEEDYGF